MRECVGDVSQRQGLTVTEAVSACPHSRPFGLCILSLLPMTFVKIIKLPSWVKPLASAVALTTFYPLAYWAPGGLS